MEGVSTWCQIKSAFNNGHLQEDKATPWIHCEKTRKESPQAEKGSFFMAAPTAWYSKVYSYFISQGFRRSCSEPTLYMKCQSTSEILILELYVDDLIVTGIKTSISSWKIWWAAFRFWVDELLPRDGSSATSGIFISQEKYANNLLKKFNMQNCKAGRRSC